MLSAVITALLLVVMLLIVASFVFGAWRERKRHLQTLTAQTPEWSLSPPDRRVTAVLQLQDGTVVGVEKPTLSFASALPSSWYRRRRTLVSAGLLLMILLALFVQSGLADGALHDLSQGFGLLNFTQHTSAFDLNTASQPLEGDASARIVRVDSALREQYYSDYQWQVWSYSSCSGIAMEEVMNSWGSHLIAADVLQVEANLGVWDVYNGLTGGEQGIAEAASYFGFKALPNPPRTMPDLIKVANKGFPVIVGVPGHILVVKGGDSYNVYLVDSAPADRTVMSRDVFANWWDGFSVVLVPR
jgi:hypothetical protein